MVVFLMDDGEGSASSAGGVKNGRGRMDPTPDVRKVHTGHPIYKNENKKGKIKKERNLP